MADSAFNGALMRSFYEGFAKGDAAAMNAVYAPDVVFSDPVFGELRGDKARAMWTMLCGALKEYSLEYEVLDANETTGHAKCVAHYLYSATGRKISNAISTTFTFEDGKVVKQVDTFDLAKWAAQALGPVGMLFGWAPPIQNKIRATASSRLAAFTAAS